MFKKIIIIFYLISNNLLADEYFLTLRNEKVNLRQGPSFEYPIKIFYKKKYLPVLIEDKSDNFKRIRDHENNSGWIHVSQLSKKKAGITIKDAGQKIAENESAHLIIRRTASDACVVYIIGS